MKCNWKSKKAIYLYGFLFLVFLIGVPKPLFYTIEGISGYIIDEKTKQPLEDVAVEVRWTGKSSGFVGWHSSGSWGLQHTRTDRSGYFFVPGYKIRWGDWFSSRVIGDNDPRIYFLKSGYESKPSTAPVLAGRGLFTTVGSRSRESFLIVGEKIEGMQDVKVEMGELPKNSRKRYEAFHHSFALGRGIHSRKDCFNESFRQSGYLLELFKEQKIALEAGLKTRIPESLQSKILNKELAAVDIERIACTLIRSNLNLYQY